MTESPLTRASLVLRLRDRGDVGAWGDFVANYGPVIYRFVRSRGLQDADASDIVQDVMRSVGMAIDRLDYEKKRGGFRAWLFTITRNKLATHFEKRGRTEQAGGDTDSFQRLNETAAGRDDLEASWELEHQRQVAARAVENVRESTEPKTWSAFEMTAMKEQAASQVAKELNMSVGAVYVARSRITARLRDEVSRLLDDEDE